VFTEALLRNGLYSSCCYNYSLLFGFLGYELCIRCLVMARGRFPHHSPTEIVTQKLNRDGKQTRQPERIVRGGVCDGVAVGPVVGVAVADGVELLR
jgi:hypothetical protein